MNQIGRPRAVRAGLGAQMVASLRDQVTVGGLMLVCLMPSVVGAQDGARIATDPDLFSARFRLEFEDMNGLFAEFGFEIEVIEGEQPPLGVIAQTYGEADESEEVEVVLGYGARERPATLTFYYYGDIGFGVLPDDDQQLVVRVKRRAE